MRVIMKRLGIVGVILWLGLLASGCAIGSQIDAAVEEIEGTLAELEMAECMRDCNDEAKTCWDDASDSGCVDTCDDEQDACPYDEDTCDDEMADCTQECGNDAMLCLLGREADGDEPGLNECMADCAQGLQDALDGIDLG